MRLALPSHFLALPAVTLVAAFAVSAVVGGCFPELPPEDEDTHVVDTQEVTLPDGDEPEVAPAPDLQDPDVPVPPRDTEVVPDGEPGDDLAETAEDVPAPDLTEDTGPGDTVEPALNLCGGLGTLDGPAPGGPCGICGDGLGVCDPTDADKNRSFCANASTLNACEGCGPLDAPLGSPCLECGAVICDPQSPGQVTCVEPSGGCEVPLSCADLGCEAQRRACEPATEEEDALCLDCLPGYLEVEGVCLRAATTPQDLEASDDDPDAITLSWSPVDGATAYRVYRCGAATCGASDWSLAPNGQVAATTYTDSQAAPAPEPAAPQPQATTSAVAHVTVSWAAVPAAEAPTYRYRVTAVAPAGESAPTAPATGSRASRAVLGYAVSVDGGSWVEVGETLSWRDDGAPAPTLSGGTATASQGTIATHVALAVSGVSASPGVSRAYRVRAISDTGVGAVSAEVTGQRAAPATWSITWERSADAADADFSPLPGASGNTWNDTDAPADGATRFYRAVVSATDAVTGRSPAVAGARLPPPGVPGNVRATSDLADRVEVRWSQVADAIGYHVYRGETLLTTGSPLSSSTLIYVDESAPPPPGPWQAPTALEASDDDPEAVHLSWTAPTRPEGPEVSYRVQAVNQAGDGELSGVARGRRALPALLSYEVQSAWASGTAEWHPTQSASTAWSYTNAPPGLISLGMVEVSDGDFRAHVALSASGQTVTPTTLTYRVRGVLEGGGHTPVSESTTGSRAVEALQRQWQRSAKASSADFTNLPGATGETYEDTEAPADGQRRFYRLRLSAEGASARTTPALVGRRLAIVQVSAGEAHTCAVAVGGRVWCWGAQESGRLGNGITNEGSVTTPATVAGIDTAVEVSAGRAHTCARLVDGTVRCWGWNKYGQLGNGGTDSSGLPITVHSLANVVGLTAGSAWTCAVLSDQTARCWGQNADYQLGNGSTSQSLVPSTLMLASGVPLTGVTRVEASSSSGSLHSCARLSSGLGRCWGYNEVGYVGQLGRQLFSYGGYPVVVSTLDRRVAISLEDLTWVSANGRHGCGVTISRDLYCWGFNSSGQLGVGDVSNRQSGTIVEFPGFSNFDVRLVGGVASGLEATCVLSDAGRVRCWGASPLGGNRNSPPSGNLGGITSASALTLGSEHGCVNESFGVKCWGRGADGRLGHGTSDDALVPTLALFP